jgi:DNA-binding MarR family transcriptional regulator/GNAT superfamily N-acetyltransferase
MAVPIEQNEQISVVREFNRFYTARLGLLRKHHLDGEFSLTEARILYEIGAAPGLTASSLRNTLALNAGYLSRTLAVLTRRKLVRQMPSTQDGREKFLTLTPAGENKVSWLNHQSARQIEDLLGNTNTTSRAALLDSFTTIRTILSEASSVRIVRLAKPSQAAMQLLQEYYEAVNVVRRDSPSAIRNMIDGPNSGAWLAYLDEKPVGCVVLRQLTSIPFASECKRLYVRPVARGHRIADKLLEALEDFARSQGQRWIYLDSYDDLRIAIAFYRKRGYVPCERYNDNPQATVFLRKDLALKF